MTHPSPNHGDRRGRRVELVVIHATNMADAAAARARLCDPATEVSAHWLIREDGAVEPLVCESRRAWHAGAGAWRGEDDVNSRSIGIELANPLDRPFPEPQMAALESLLAAILARHGLRLPSGIIETLDVSVARGLIGRMIDIEITEALPHSLRGMLAGTAGDAAGIAAAAG